LLWLFAIGLYGYPLIPVTMLSIAAAALIQPTLSGSVARGSLIAAGAATGVSALFRYDVAPVVFAALCIVLALSCVSHATDRRDALRRAIAALGWFCLGAVATFLPAAALYLAVAPPDGFLFDIFQYAVPNYARMRSLPFPGLGLMVAQFERAGVYIPLFACAVAAWSFASERLRRDDRRDWLIATFLLLTLTMYLKGLVRVSNAHLVASIVSAIVLIAVSWNRIERQARALRIAATLVAVLAVSTALFATSTTARERIAARNTVLAKALVVLMNPGSIPCPTPPELHNIECLLVDPDREQAARLVAAATVPGERIFVGLTRHDKIFMNDIAMYFAADRMPATHWHHFDSGLQTTAEIQSLMVKELGAAAVRYVVLESTWDWIAEPNASASAGGGHLLDEYIRANFHPIATFGEITVLQRN
jgi:hypothetical protein